MKKKLFFGLLLTLPWIGVAQTARSPYVHHLEIGASKGRDEVGTRFNPSLKSLHGVRILPHHVMGFVIGLDPYPLATTIPFGVGWRGTLHPEKKFSWTSGMDIGYGSTVLEKKEISEWNQHTWFEGGLMAHPTVGFRIKNKEKSAWTFQFGYKHQQISYYQGTPSADPWIGVPNPSNPDHWNYIRRDKIMYRNLTFAVGLLFR